jgi:predicted transcriptional regulator
VRQYFSRSQRENKVQNSSVDQEPRSIDLLIHTAQIVAAHVGHNAVAPVDVPVLIRSVHEALAAAGRPQPQETPPEPAVPIRRSVQPDYLICLEDGKKLKMLRRHLQTAFGMTPEEYRAKWGLSHDYPMVAPNYAKQRSQLAKQIGLGRRTPAPVVEAPPAKAPAKRGRKKASAS